MLLVMYLNSRVVALNFSKTLNKALLKPYEFFLKKKFSNQFIYYLLWSILLGFISFFSALWSAPEMVVPLMKLLDKYWNIDSNLSLSLESTGI